MDPKQIVHSDPEVLGGTPVFVGTRVPVQALLDFLECGDTIEEFLDNYPGVSREQAVAFLEEAGRAAPASARPCRVLDSHRAGRGLGLASERTASPPR